jgi:hypothetical protein
MKSEKRHDIVFQVKKSAYIHKYREPFVLKNLDGAMAILEKIIATRKSGTKRRIYCEFIDNDIAEYKGPKHSDDYYSYGAALCVTEEEIHKAIKDLRVLAPAVVDALGGLWWSITNSAEDIRTDEGLAINKK